MTRGWGADETPAEKRARKDIAAQAKRDKARRKHQRQVERQARKDKRKRS